MLGRVREQRAVRLEGAGQHHQVVPGAVVTMASSRRACPPGSRPASPPRGDLLAGY